MTGLATNAQLHQGHSGVVLPGDSGVPSCSLHGCSREEWARVVQKHPPSLHRAFGGAFLCCREHALLLTAAAVRQKGQENSRSPSFYVALWWWEGLLPETLAKLQIHHRSSAVSRPFHKQLPKTLDPCRVPGILQAAATVCDRSCSTDMSLTSLLTVTPSDTFSFVFHYSDGFLRADRVTLFCLSYKINL